MSEINALKELRDFRNTPDYGYWADEIIELADKIEAEIAERYMELPVDADGVPIHVGDEIECHANGYDGTFTVFAISNNVAVGNHDIEWIRRNPDKWFHVASFCTHVKLRTLEDVLEEFADMPERIDRVAATKRYADEIRELLGVGE